MVGADPGAFYSANTVSGQTPLEALSAASSTDVAITTAGSDLYVMYSVASGPDAGVWAASSVNLNALSVPEPAAVSLLVLGAVAFALGVRRRR